MRYRTNFSRNYLLCNEDAEKIFKMVTDGAVIPVERKYHAPQEKRAKARCVFLANELPFFVDRSHGLWDRLIVLPFTKRFRDTDSEKANLKYELEAELPGIFNWAIDGARKLEKMVRFPVPSKSKEASITPSMPGMPVAVLTASVIVEVKKFIVNPPLTCHEGQY